MYEILFFKVFLFKKCFLCLNNVFEWRRFISRLCKFWSYEVTAEKEIENKKKKVRVVNNIISEKIIA